MVTFSATEVSMYGNVKAITSFFYPD